MKNNFFIEFIFTSVMHMQKKAFSLIITILLLLAPWIAIIGADPSSNPTADTGGPYSGTVGETIQFDGSKSFAVNGTITSYEWFCGDGSVETGINPTHIYSHPGVYTLTLTVKDEDNNCGTETTQVSIEEDQPPTGSFSQPAEKGIYFRDSMIGATNTSSILIGSSTIIVEATDDIGIDNVKFYIDKDLKHTDDTPPYEWSWKNGHFSHTLKAVITDSSGQQTTIQQQIFKWRLHPLLLLSSLSLLGRQQDNSFSWMTGNNQDTAILFTLLKTILNRNNQESNTLFSLLEQLLNSDEESSNLATFLENHPLIRRRVQENHPLIYRFIMLQSNQGFTSNNNLFNRENALLKSLVFALIRSALIKDDSGLNLNTDNTGLFNDNNQELFKDNEFITWIKDHPVLTIISALLLLRLIQSIRNRISDDDSVNDTVQNKDPVARVGGPYNGIIGESITFSAKNSYDDDGRIVLYEWDFGDGITGTGETIIHTYEETGEYLVMLTVTDEYGATSNETTTVLITEHIEEFSSENGNENAEFWIIAGGLTALLAAGLAILQFRRRLFE